MLKPLLYLMYMVINVHPGVLVISGLTDRCRDGKCRDGGPLVRFPFVIEGRQPAECGYPGFRLSCNHQNETILHLPKFPSLLVKSIDYKFQLVHLSDPERCLPRLLLDPKFVANVTPFQFQDLYDSYEGGYTLFNCSRRKISLYDSYEMSCQGSLDFQVCATPWWTTVDDSDLLSCTKIHDVSSIPYDIFHQNDIILNWSVPSCGFCESKGQRCGFNHTTTTSQLQCYDPPKHEGSITKVIVTGAVVGLFMLVAIAGILYRKYSIDKDEKEFEKKVNNFLEDYKALNPTRFSYADVKKITNEFKHELGQGAYGIVYKGKLSENFFVAVKVLNNSTGNGEEFINEVGTMAKIHHVNVVRLVGFCADGYRRALVYEYLPNESLARFVTSPDAKDKFLGWKRLQDIAFGIARGIEYLHQGCDQRILHFDIKPHNILLDDDFNPKITDFGLAKLCDKDQSAVSMTIARGTVGYIAPEVFSRNFGNVSYKSDVYSFGMLVLEMVGGRKIVDDKTSLDDIDKIYFPMWIYNILEQGEEDLRLEIEEEGDARIAKKLAIVGLCCIQWNPSDRPSMKTVIQMLEGEGDTLTAPPNPFSSVGPSKRNVKKLGRCRQPELEVISEME